MVTERNELNKAADKMEVRLGEQEDRQRPLFSSTLGIGAPPPTRGQTKQRLPAGRAAGAVTCRRGSGLQRQRDEHGTPAGGGLAALVALLCSQYRSHSGLRLYYCSTTQAYCSRAPTG